MVDGNAVYISFDTEEDTVRYSFVSHLSAAFDRRKISFLGEEPTSDDHAAIEKSRVAVVIFSEKYASSKPCLEDMFKVYECMRSNGLVVVPVFYGLKRSVLSKQCLILKNMYPEDRVADWRNTLLEIADLPGHTSSNERSDSELVEEIVADVRQKLDRTSKIGIYSRMMKIESLLAKQPFSKRSLGLWGMGGIGKTTLAEAAFKQMSSDFEASYFIKDFDESFQKNGIYGLLEEHFGKDPGLRSRQVTREKLRNKRILIVLDDVNKPLGATTFLGWFDGLGSGSLIIITSRDKQVLVQCRVNDIYEVQGLNKYESLHLFSKQAFGKDVIDQNLLELSKKIVEHADGNPLALSIYGRELEGKTQSEMESVVFKLKQGLPEKMFDVLKRSYDTLSDSEKNIFLEIGCFFRGANVEYVVQFLAGCGFFPRVGIDVLMEKSLVTISNNMLQMHNLVYHVVHKIIICQVDEIGKGYKFLNASNFRSLFEENEIRENRATKLGNGDVKAIMLDTSYNLAFKGHIAFQHMYNLRCLAIFRPDCTVGAGFRFHEDNQSLPSELRLLYWENYPLQSFPKDFDIQNLVDLNMQCSELQKLWGGTKNLEMLKKIRLCHSQQLVNVDELQYCRNIELIDLRGCLRLQNFPDISQSQCLEDLNLSFCAEINSFPKVPQSIKKLHLQGTGIKDLSIFNRSLQIQGLSNALLNHAQVTTSQVKVGCSNQDLGKLKDCSHLRSMLDFESLEILDLSGCSELEKIQDFPRNLKALYLSKTAIKEIPLSICNHLSELATLDMEYCERLQDIPEGMSNMESLATLKLSGCSKLEKIWDLPRNLKELYLDKTAVKAFPLENLSKLVTLCLENCKKLQHFPVGFRNLESLVTLKLSGCSRLEDIHGFPQNLKELYLVGTAIKELPSSIGDLSELAILDLKNCKKLQYLPVQMKNMNPLKVLDLSDCSKLEVVTGSLPKARVLRLARTGMLVNVTEKKAEKTVEETRGNTQRRLTKRRFWNCFKLQEVF